MSSGGFNMLAWGSRRAYPVRNPMRSKPEVKQRSQEFYEISEQGTDKYLLNSVLEKWVHVNCGNVYLYDNLDGKPDFDNKEIITIQEYEYMINSEAEA